MSDWISRPELENLIGKDAADILCCMHGGVPFYVPVRAKQGIELAKTIGFGRACVLCSVYGGSYITVPIGNRPEPYKIKIMRLIDEGKRPSQIAKELGTTERYVRTIMSHYRKRPRQLSLF